jgi:competence protein ComEA
MDRSATPWRELDDGSPGDQAGASGTSQGDREGAPTSTMRLPWTVIGGFVLAAVMAIGAFAIAASTPRGEVTLDGGATFSASGLPRASAVASSGADLVVDVQGAVLRPGVRGLEPGSRVGDAIAAAGGYGPRVDAVRAGRELNLAATLKDGDRIVVPSRDDPPGTAGSGLPAPGGDGSSGGEPGGVVDLNRATAAQLDELPGIGPVTAQKIIDARAERPFATVDELRERKIIGSSTFEKLRLLITVR